MCSFAAAGEAEVPVRQARRDDSEESEGMELVVDVALGIDEHPAGGIVRSETLADVGAQAGLLEVDEFVVSLRSSSKLSPLAVLTT